MSTVASHELYELLGEPVETDRRVLVHAFTGFLDAGSAGRLAVDHLLRTRPHRELARFDADALLDYRARRPRMEFRSDHFATIDIPEIRLHEVTDADGRPFLLLEGPEPDYRWRAFVAAVADLVERFDVRLVAGLAAVPWPAPHTRPMGITWHGTEADVLAAHPSALGDLEVPGHVGGMLELVLGGRGVPVVGLAAHVPHYLVQFDYPRAVMTLLDALSEATGLALPATELEPAAARADAEIASQLAGNEEFQVVLATLERQYDDTQASLAEVPTADEIGAQVEQFLARMDERGAEED